MRKIKDILFILVLYKRSITESETYQSILKELEEQKVSVSFYVYDNSPEPQYLTSNDHVTFHYEHDATNSGVSKAYNHGVDLAIKNNIKWVVILDQDTQFPSGFLSHYTDVIKNTNEGDSLYTPILLDNNKLLSPCRYILHRGFHLNEKDLIVKRIKIKNKSFLNSGVMIKAKKVEEIGGFDESLFYYSDHDFFYRSVKFISYTNILEVVLEHSLSSSVNVDSPQTLQRLRMLKAASFIMAKKHKSLFPIFWFYLRAIKLALKNKKLIYILS